MSSILFGDTMVPNIEKDSILLLGYTILYKEYNLTRFNHQKNATRMIPIKPVKCVKVGGLQPAHPLVRPCPAGSAGCDSGLGFRV